MRRGARSERDLPRLARIRVKPAEVAGTLRGEPHAAVDSRRNVVWVRTSRHGVFLDDRLGDDGRGWQRERQDQQEACKASHRLYCRTLGMKSWWVWTC